MWKQGRWQTTQGALSMLKEDESWTDSQVPQQGDKKNAGA